MTKEETWSKYIQYSSCNMDQFNFIWESATEELIRQLNEDINVAISHVDLFDSQDIGYANGLDRALELVNNSRK